MAGHSVPLVALLAQSHPEAQRRRFCVQISSTAMPSATPMRANEYTMSHEPDQRAIAQAGNPRCVDAAEQRAPRRDEPIE